MAFEFEIKFGRTLQLLNAVGDGLTKVYDKTTKVVAGFQKPIDWDKLGRVEAQINHFTQNLQRLGDGLMGVLQPGISFEQKMAELKASTGITNKALVEIGKSARGLAKEFGLSADDISDTYLQLLSKLSPELAKTKEGQQALAQMTRTTAMLSKGMGGDIKGATEALTTMMNAYNIDISKPEQAAKAMATIGDMLTASFKDGAVDVGDLANSMKALGATGYAANVSLSETLGTLQVIGQKGAKMGAEGGVAFRNALAQLAQGELMPEKTLKLLKGADVKISQLTDKTKTFAERMAALKPIAKNDALMGEFFGKENVVAGQAILQNLDLIKQYTASAQNAQGANAAFASGVMNTTQGALDRMKANFTDLSLSMYESLKPYVPMIALSSQIAVGIGAVAPLFATVGTLMRAGAGYALQYGLGLTAVNGQLAFQQRSLVGVTLGLFRYIGAMAVSGVGALGSFLVSMGAATVGQWLLNAAMYANPIGLVIVGVAALGGLLWALSSAFGGVGNALSKMWEFVKNYNPFTLIAKTIDWMLGSNLTKQLGGFFNWVEEKMRWLWDKVSGLGEMIGLVSGSANETATGAPKFMQTIIDKVVPKKAKTKEASGEGSNKTTDIFGGGSEMSKLPTLAGDKKADANVSAGLAAVAGGGQKQTNITINLQKLQDKTEIHTTNFDQGSEQAERKIIELMMRVLNSTYQYTT